MSESNQVPKASRPHMPGYGILDADSGNGLLPWSWATERLAGSHNYYLATVRADGRPHAMPVWGVWMNDSFYFSTGRQSRKARNLTANPYCVICTEKLDEAVMVEGSAEEIPALSLPAPVAEAYFAKYGWKLDPDMGPIYKVRPAVVFGIDEKDFVGGTTRWTFGNN